MPVLLLQKKISRLFFSCPVFVCSSHLGEELQGAAALIVQQSPLWSATASQRLAAQLQNHQWELPLQGSHGWPHPSEFNQDVMILITKCVEMIMSVLKFIVNLPDKDETSVRVDKEGVHRGREHAGRAGGSGESSDAEQMFYLFYLFISFFGFLLHSKQISCHHLPLTTSWCFFCYSSLAVPLISSQHRPPPGFEMCDGTTESCRLLLSLILIANLLGACWPKETFRFGPLPSWRGRIWNISFFFLEETGGSLLSSECFCIQ